VVWFWYRLYLSPLLCYGGPSTLLFSSLLFNIQKTEEMKRRDEEEEHMPVMT
jgi:hypothetical protein